MGVFCGTKLPVWPWIERREQLARRTGRAEVGPEPQDLEPGLCLLVYRRASVLAFSASWSLLYVPGRDGPLSFLASPNPYDLDGGRNMAMFVSQSASTLDIASRSLSFGAGWRVQESGLFLFRDFDGAFGILKPGKLAETTASSGMGSLLCSDVKMASWAGYAASPAQPKPLVRQVGCANKISDAHLTSGVAPFGRRHSREQDARGERCSGPRLQ